MPSVTDSGGRLPPSYQVRFKGGRPSPRAGKVILTMLDLGPVSGIRGSPCISTVDGEPSFRPQ
jgi:hypothetical protein